MWMDETQALGKQFRHDYREWKMLVRMLFFNYYFYLFLPSWLQLCITYYWKLGKKESLTDMT